MSPSPAPVAAFRTATWWVSLWVSTPATTPGSSPGSVPGARPGGVCHHDDAPSSWWARRSGPSRQDVDGALQARIRSCRAPTGAGGSPAGRDADRSRPGQTPGPPVELRVTRPRRTGTYILHVQICCKGAPGRDRRREEARNTNDSPRALRRDPGLCNRFGQLDTAGPCADGDLGDHPGLRAGPPRPWASRCAFCTRAGTSNRTSRGRNAPLESRMHISTSTGPIRPHHPERLPPTPPRPTDHDSR